MANVMMQGKVLDPAVPDCIIASYAQAGLMHMAFSTFDLFFDELQLEATTDSYAAILHACIENGAFDSVPLVCRLILNICNGRAHAIMAPSRLYHWINSVEA